MTADFRCRVSSCAKLQLRRAERSENMLFDEMNEINYGRNAD